MVLLKRFDYNFGHVTKTMECDSWKSAQDMLRETASLLEYQGFTIYNRKDNSLEAYCRGCRVKYYITK